MREPLDRAVVAVGSAAGLVGFFSEDWQLFWLGILAASVMATQAATNEARRRQEHPDG